MTARGMECYEPQLTHTRRNLTLLNKDRYLVSLIIIVLRLAPTTSSDSITCRMPSRNEVCGYERETADSAYGPMARSLGSNTRKSISRLVQQLLASALRS